MCSSTRGSAISPPRPTAMGARPIRRCSRGATAPAPAARGWRWPPADAFAARRVPVRPVPAAALMFEAAEFDAPLLVDPSPNQRLVPVSAPPPATRHCDVLVIGGGSVGLSVAYYLARDGADVMVADRDETGLAAATANAGSLHVQLLSYDYGHPGMPEDGGPAAQTMPPGLRSIAP